MREFQYTPKTGGFEGYVKIKILNYKERLAMAKELGLGSGESGIENSNVDLAEKMATKAEEYVTEVSLKKGDVVCTSLDDLSYYEEGFEVMQEIMQVMMKGISLGKTLPLK